MKATKIDISTEVFEVEKGQQVLRQIERSPYAQVAKEGEMPAPVTTNEVTYILQKIVDHYDRENIRYYFVREDQHHMLKDLMVVNSGLIEQHEQKIRDDAYNSGYWRGSQYGYQKGQGEWKLDYNKKSIWWKIKHVFTGFYVEYEV